MHQLKELILSFLTKHLQQRLCNLFEQPDIKLTQFSSMRQGRKWLWLLILDKAVLNSSQNSLDISRFQHIFLAYSAPVLCTAAYLSICYPFMELGSMGPLAVVHSLPAQDIQVLNHPLEDILVCKQLFHSYIFTKEGKQMAFAKASNNTNPLLMFCFT